LKTLLTQQVKVHKTFVAIIEKLEGDDVSDWVYPNEWQTYILDPDKCDDNEDVYYREKLPQEDAPVVAGTNRSIPCVAMYFEHQKAAGLVVTTLLIIAGIGFIAVVIWYFARKDAVGAALILATIVGVPLTVGQIFSHWVTE
jgi:hypothetical protein